MVCCDVPICILVVHCTLFHSREPEQQVPPDDTDFGPSIAAVDNGQATSPSHLSMTTSKYNHSPIDQPSSPVASSTGGLTSDGTLPVGTVCVDTFYTRYTIIDHFVFCELHDVQHEGYDCVLEPSAVSVPKPHPEYYICHVILKHIVGECLYYDVCKLPVPLL